MEAIESPTGSSSPTPMSAPIKRKHRPGLHRTQIACQRCRLRKNKCDGKIPSCTTCEKAGTPCTVVDRLTYRQYPRGHVEDLEAQIVSLKEENDQLRAELQMFRQSGISTPLSQEASVQAVPAVSEHDLASNIARLSLEGSSEKKYVGESSGVHFGNIVQALVPLTDYKRAPSSGRFPLRVERPSSGSSPAMSDGGFHPKPVPSLEIANMLQVAYFETRWASFPLLHRPTFMEKHFSHVMQHGMAANHASLFLVYMVFAIASIDLQRQKKELVGVHLEFFNTATSMFLGGLMAADNLETIQGLLLMTIFAINEPQSINAWMVNGLAIRFAIDLGLHRKSYCPTRSLLRSEMKKRIFWSAYALDRNISVALGRPFCIQDREINVDLPLQLTDQQILEESAPEEAFAPSIYDMSTFRHIVRLRQIHSKILRKFYPVNASEQDGTQFQESRDQIRAELEQWMVSTPRYISPTTATFQSFEWFQIAYNHALILLYRPSPVCPQANLQVLQICADSSINMITGYLALYSKNKITYTWIALHSVFMASVTMLYTLVAPEIRRSTTRAVVKSNINSCLSLFEDMGKLWPAAASRSYTVIERLGRTTLNLFEDSTILNDGRTQGAAGNRFGEIDQEYMEWFGMKDHIGPFSDEFSDTAPRINVEADPVTSQSLLQDQAFNGIMDMEGLFDLGFDMSLPLMTDVCGMGDGFAQGDYSV
ncbi:uncharacterized protein LY89DRAFT_785771 [Mollisia scopiformis]|uniref:Zn(2)-C6 fungal-type domain-containing protein n=1 Tax=Mollisia scopiformis TaxID=149040 RepID=A0A194WWQ4_MOLSC|nr:uncharacterized protein LY89DRAFT_785771 [Mollisia scopiformis]KUJ12403.1 hypothetical protein LY89DRAFT_785771 [Mollisia scopiformis]